MYQIEIYRKRYDQPVDMNAVCAAIADLMTDDQALQNGDEAREHSSVYVRFDSISEAVARINALGYETDEDNSEEGDDAE